MNNVFTTDENELTLKGRRYVATETETPGRCLGCAFPEGFGCKASRLLQESPRCQPKWRKDGRSIVWVRAHKA